MIKKLLILTISIALVFSQSAADDLVTDLPGYGAHDYKIYSGMLDVSEAGSQLHYMLLEAAQVPVQDAPLVIWLNGGPGCSSLLGLIQENGPFLFQGINTFLSDMQEFSWNNNANMLYIEGPPGVGYSVNKDGLNFSDDKTAVDFMTGLNEFRKRFQGTDIDFSNPLWLSGESYAGMYVPFFTKQILDHNKVASENDKWNVKGFLVGNNVQIMDESFLDVSLQNQYVENYFVNDETKQYFYEDCVKDQKSANCKQYKRTFANISNNTDAYSIYNYTYNFNQVAPQSSREVMLDYIAEKSPFMKDIRQIIKESRKDIESNDDQYTPDSIISSYFNLKEVKEALHVPMDKLWMECSPVVGVLYQRAANSQHLYPEFVEAGLSILIFSGNDDAVVPWQYTDYCIEDMQTNPDYKINLTKKGNWRQWKKLSSQQVGGMVQYYETDKGQPFVYAMVRAAGHEVPMYQPLAAYHMFNNFINGEPI